MSSTFLLYGATGFTGEAIARVAMEHGLRPILAGRDAARLEQLATELGVESRVFDLHDPQKIEQDLMKIIPQERWTLFSHQVIHHGRSLCVARNPKCAECPLDPLCYAKDKTV